MDHHATETPLQEAIRIAGGKTSLMRKLNEMGWEISSHNVITQWEKSGIPAKYCPDIYTLTGVTCERLLPTVNWEAVRNPPQLIDTEGAPAVATEQGA